MHLCQVQTVQFTEYKCRYSTPRSDIGFGGFSRNLLKTLLSYMGERDGARE